MFLILKQGSTAIKAVPALLHASEMPRTCSFVVLVIYVCTAFDISQRFSFPKYAPFNNTDSCNCPKAVVLCATYRLILILNTILIIMAKNILKSLPSAIIRNLRKEKNAHCSETDQLSVFTLSSLWRHGCGDSLI